MGLLDGLAGQVLGGLAAQAQGGHAGGATGGNPLGDLLGGLLGGALGGSAGGAGGGLAALIALFQQRGLGDVVQSWVGTGQNLPVSAEQLHSVFGPELLSALGAMLGTGTGDTANRLAQVLPGFVDGLTPQGQLPAEDPLGANGVDDLVAALKRAG